MKKVIKKGIIFLLFFAIIFIYLSNVFQANKVENNILTNKLKTYEKEDTVDVLFCGTSTMEISMLPIIMWKDSGLKGINLSTNSNNALCNYYLIKYALQKKTPKFIVMDFDALTEDRRADVEKFESTYRRVVTSMPDLGIKKQMIDDIVSKNEKQKKSSYYLTLLRYHSRWSDIKKQDFIYDSSYQCEKYLKGAVISEEIEGELSFSGKKWYDESTVNIDEHSLYYYMKIIELCREKNITIIAVSTPAFCGWINYAKFDIIKKFCSEQGIEYINYNDEQSFERLNIDLSQDYIDNGLHLNISGSIKVINDFTKQIKKLYNMEYYADEINDSDWEEQWNLFAERYSVILEEVNYDVPK